MTLVGLVTSSVTSSPVTSPDSSSYSWQVRRPDGPVFHIISGGDDSCVALCRHGDSVITPLLLLLYLLRLPPPAIPDLWLLLGCWSKTSQAVFNVRWWSQGGEEKMIKRRRRWTPERRRKRRVLGALESQLLTSGWNITIVSINQSILRSLTDELCHPILSLRSSF